MGTVSPFSSVTKTVSVVALVASTSVFQSTGATELKQSTIQADILQKISTSAKVIYAEDTSVGLSVKLLTSQEVLAKDLADYQEKLESEIISFEELKACWDGEDAEPISIGAIDSALKFLKEYRGTLLFDAFPDPDGSVGVQADFAGGRVILSFNDTGDVAYLIRKNKAQHRGHGASHKTINSLFSSLL